MSNKRFAEEIKLEAAKQVMERGHPVVEVASRLGGIAAQPVRVDQTVSISADRAD